MEGAYSITGVLVGGLVVVVDVGTDERTLCLLLLAPVLTGAEVDAVRVETVVGG